MDVCQGTIELKNLENQLNFISENFSKSYFTQYYKGQGTASQVRDNLQIIKNNIDNLQQKCIYNLTELDLFGGLEDIKDFPQIHKQISEGKIIEYQLLYQGTRDGLNGRAYWAKCNWQQNLFTIMTCKNGNRFGGYSPCQINQQLNNYVQDPTLKSFIFQYNKKEIYKLKIKENAVFCGPYHGPAYGGKKVNFAFCYDSQDIYVNLDFQGGSSSGLGNSYDVSGYNIVDKANHIFGATTPQLQECKVYEVIFK